MAKDGIRWKLVGGAIETKTKFQWKKVPFWIKEVDFDSKISDNDESANFGDADDVESFFRDIE